MAPGVGPDAVPDVHVEQPVAPSVEWEPGAQSEQDAAPPLAEKRPPGQTVQSSAFVVFEKVPALQSLQLPSALELQAVARRVPG